MRNHTEPASLDLVGGFQQNYYISSWIAYTNNQFTVARMRSHILKQTDNLTGKFIHIILILAAKIVCACNEPQDDTSVVALAERCLCISHTSTMQKASPPLQGRQPWDLFHEAQLWQLRAQDLPPRIWHDIYKEWSKECPPSNSPRSVQTGHMGRRNQSYLYMVYFISHDTDERTTVKLSTPKADYSCSQILETHFRAAICTNNKSHWKKSTNAWT